MKNNKATTENIRVTYRIEYYEPDGSSSPLESIERAEPLHNTEYPTLRAARHAIRLRATGRGRYGQWSPEEAVTAYHESRREGCGGYAIVEVPA